MLPTAVVFSQPDWAKAHLPAAVRVKSARGAVPVNWRSAEIGIRGKGGPYDFLPLPADARAAVAAWLRDGRPAAGFREVFTTVIAPTRPLTREAAASIVRCAAVRAGSMPARAWTGSVRWPGAARRRSVVTASLHDRADEYLRLRRALGFRLRNEGRALAQFAGYLEQQGATAVTAEHAVTWAQLLRGVHSVTWTHGLTAVRGFAAWLRTIDPATGPSPC